MTGKPAFEITKKKINKDSFMKFRDPLNIQKYCYQHIISGK